MYIFLKIGLPWAISLGIIFYLGLELGSQSGTQSNQEQVNLTQKKNAFQSVHESESFDKTGSRAEQITPPSTKRYNKR